MNRKSSHLLWIAPALALVLPPFLLIPLKHGLPGGQFFKDLYEACLWVSPAVGVVVLVLIFRRWWVEAGALRQGVVIAGVILAILDLVSPLFFYVLLAILAGH